MDKDCIVSFEEWCIQCDVRGVNCFFASLKNISVPTFDMNVRELLLKLPKLTVDTDDRSSTTYYIISLNFIKELRAKPLDWLRVESHDLPFANEIEIEFKHVYDNGKLTEWQSLFGYISWQYSSLDDLRKRIDYVRLPLQERLRKLNSCISTLEEIQHDPFRMISQHI